MPKLNAERVSNVDDAIDECQKTLGKWLEEDKDSPGATAAISLAMALNPGWCRWLKESGSTNQDIVVALSKVTASLICEVIGNVANEKNHQALGKVMTGLITSYIEYGLARLDKGASLPAFRLQDA